MKNVLFIVLCFCSIPLNLYNCKVTNIYKKMKKYVVKNIKKMYNHYLEIIVTRFHMCCIMEDDILENRVEKAARLFKEGYNCAQAVVAAFSDLYGIDEETALRLSCSFGAGIGRMREVCGAVSGMAIIAGLENGVVDGKDVKGKKDNYDLVNVLVDEFKKTNGTIICRELLGKKKNESKKVDTMPDARNDEYYRTRPCLKQVIECATIVEQHIIENSKKINRKVDFVQVSNPDHVTKVVELADNIWRECYKNILSNEHIEYMIDKYQSDNIVTKKMINEGYEYYLLNNGKYVIGFISFLKDEDTLRLSNIYVLEEYRNKGYCSLAIKKILKNCKDTTIKTVTIILNKLNEEALKLYSDMGFKVKGYSSQDIGNGYVLDNCILEKNV